MNYISCGGMNIPGELASLCRVFYAFIMIGVPVGLIVLGSKDIITAVTGIDEKAIKKARDKFVKRLLSAGIVFFVFTTVSLLIGLLSANTDSKSYTKCISCLIKDETSCEQSSWNTTDIDTTGEELEPEVGKDLNSDNDEDDNEEENDGASSGVGGTRPVVERD